VRELVNIIVSDVQPPTSIRILKKVKKLGGDQEAKKWAIEVMEKGLSAYDKIAEKYAGKYSVEDEITLADVVLAPAVEGFLWEGVDIEKYKTVSRVYNNVRVLDAFKKADYKHQEDTPEELRAKD